MEDQILSGKTLLVVDDEEDLREIVSSELEFMGAKVFQAANITEAKEINANNLIDLVISDIRMPGGSGIDLLKHLKSISIHHPPVILVTGFADISNEEAFHQGAEALMNKPFKLDELIHRVFKLTSGERFNPANLKPVTPDFHVTFHESLAQKINSHECALGRGGITLLLKSSLIRFHPDERINFQITFQDMEFIGRGVCLWLKYVEESDSTAVGLEFLKLSDATSTFFQKYLREHQMVPFISRLS